MQFESSLYSGRDTDLISNRKETQDNNTMSAESSQREDYTFGSESYSEKQSERDWDRRPNREREKSRSWDYPQDEDDEDRDRFSKSSKSEYSKRYSDTDRRSNREDSDRRSYYDSSPRSRERDRERDTSSSREGTRDRDAYESSSRDASRRRDYRDSRSSRDQFDSRDGKDSRSRSSSRDARSGRDRDRRESRNYDKDWDGHDRDRRLKDNGSPESLDSYDRGSDYHGSRTSGDSRYRDADGYKSQVPNSTIMIRGLAQHITESDIQQDILRCGLMPKDIRLIRKKDTGASRGFAFVEFNTVQEASRWMEMKQGILMLQERYRAEMHFSIPKDPSFDRSMLKSGIQDWHCVICGAHNFKRRDTCFKCHASRQVSDEGGEGSDEVSPHQTNTVLLRNLDVLSTEDSVLQALKNQQFSNLPIRSIRIGQDALTNTSRGICYIELNNVLDSVYLHDALVSDPLVVDGRKALVSYCKVPQRTSSTTGSFQSDRDSQWSSHGANSNHQYRAEDIPRLAEYCASLYATSSQDRATYVQYYTQYYKNQLAQGGTITLPSQTQTDSVNAAAAVAQSAIQQLQAAKEIKKTAEDSRQGKADENGSYDVYKMAQLKGHATQAAAAGTYHQNASGGVTATNTSVPYISVPPQGATGLQKYPVPDVSTYQYDGTSGYYYDSQTGLYYDANSQYYYNAQTQQFLYWEAEKQTYLPAPAVNTSTNEDTNSQKDDGKKVKGKEKQDKVKVAKKIAKDMERWAKTLNQKKDNASQNVILASASTPSKSIGAADAGYAILERKERQTQDSMLASLRDAEEKQVNAAEAASGGVPGLVAAYGGGSESDEEIEDVLQEDRQHTNWAKLACLLCKRQFPSKESLIRHQQLSDLHKQNLESWYKVRGLDPHDPQQRNNKYRDRAKERRLKFGEPEPPQPNRLKEKYLKGKEEAVSVSYEEPTKNIGSENVGNKLLQKMGWQEGQGLGKTNQGRTSIIQTEQRNSTAGLGAKDSTYGALPGETYKDCVKKMMFARYQELTEQEQSSES